MEPVDIFVCGAFILSIFLSLAGLIHQFYVSRQSRRANEITQRHLERIEGHLASLVGNANHLEEDLHNQETTALQFSRAQASYLCHLVGQVERLLLIADSQKLGAPRFRVSTRSGFHSTVSHRDRDDVAT